jgi:hypothetical protein
MIAGGMSGSATRWLVAAAACAGLLGLVLRLSDVAKRGTPSRVPGAAAEVPRPSAAGVASDAAPPEAGPLEARADAPGAVDAAEEARPSAADAPAVRAARRAGGWSETPRPRGPAARHRTAVERKSGRHRPDAALVAGAVDAEPLARLEGREGAAAAVPAARPAAPGAPDTAPPPPPTDVTFSSGDERTFATDAPVEITDVPKLAGATGSLSFWLQPGWEGANQDDASLLELGDGRLRIVKNVDYLRFEWTDDGGTAGGIGTAITEWQPGEWHAVTTTWNGTSFALYVDGKLVSEKSDAGHVGLPDDATLVIGSDFPENRPVAPGVIQKVDVRRRPLTPDEVAQQFAAATGGTRR